MTLKDPTKNAMRVVVDPFMAHHKFKRTKERVYLRTRGEFVDCVSIDYGRWGNTYLYIHYSIHLLADPRINVNTYSFGDRISVDWSPRDHELALKNAETIVGEIQKIAFAWFDRVSSIEIYEGVSCQYLWEATLCAFLQECGARGSILLRNLIAQRDFPTFQYWYPESKVSPEEAAEKEARQVARAKVLSDWAIAVQEGRFVQWAEENRRRNMLELGLQ